MGNHEADGSRRLNTHATYQRFGTELDIKKKIEIFLKAAKLRTKTDNYAKSTVSYNRR